MSAHVGDIVLVRIGDQDVPAIVQGTGQHPDTKTPTVDVWVFSRTGGLGFEGLPWYDSADAAAAVPADDQTLHPHPAYPVAAPAPAPVPAPVVDVPPAPVVEV